MRLLALFAGGLFAAGLLAADDKKDAPEDALVGTWALEKFETGKPGSGLPADDVAKIKLVIKKGGKLTLIQADGKEKESTFKLDPISKQKAIDITGDTNTSLGLYELDGDVLKLCMAQGGKRRPTELKPDGTGDVVVMTLKRVKDEKKDT